MSMTDKLTYGMAHMGINGDGDNAPSQARTATEVTRATPELHFLPSKPATTGEEAYLSGAHDQACVASAFSELARQHVAKMKPRTFSMATSAYETMNAAGPLSIHHRSSTPLNLYNNDRSTPTALAPTSFVSSAITASGPAATVSHLATLGVGYGPGINPNITQFGGDGNGSGLSMANNPPIVNTGNNGPMFIQPGDWVCSSCGFVNWRRRKVCMRCFPFADQSEVSTQIAQGAILAAKLAAGVDLAPDAMKALTGVRKPSSVSSASLPSTPALASFDPQSDGYLAQGRHRYDPSAQHSSSTAQPLPTLKANADVWHPSAGNTRTTATMHNDGRSHTLDHPRWAGLHPSHASAVPTATHAIDSLASTPSSGHRHASVAERLTHGAGAFASGESIWKADSMWCSSAGPSRGVGSCRPRDDRSSPFEGGVTAEEPNDGAANFAASPSPCLLPNAVMLGTVDGKACITAEPLANEQDEIIVPFPRQARRANTTRDTRFIGFPDPALPSSSPCSFSKASPKVYQYSAIEPPSKAAER